MKKLNLKMNKLTTLPDELSTLVNLTELDVSRNQITQLPITLASLYNLLTLNLSYNNLTELPTEIFGGGVPVEADDGQMYVQGMFALREVRLRDNYLTNIIHYLFHFFFFFCSFFLSFSSFFFFLRVLY